MSIKIPGFLFLCLLLAQTQGAAAQIADAAAEAAEAATEIEENVSRAEGNQTNAAARSAQGYKTESRAFPEGDAAIFENYTLPIGRYNSIEEAKKDAAKKLTTFHELASSWDNQHLDLFAYSVIRIQHKKNTQLPYLLTLGINTKPHMKDMCVAFAHVGKAFADCRLSDDLSGMIGQYSSSSGLVNETKWAFRELPQLAGETYFVNDFFSLHAQSNLLDFSGNKTVCVDDAAFFVAILNVSPDYEITKQKLAEEVREPAIRFRNRLCPSATAAYVTYFVRGYEIDKATGKIVAIDQSYYGYDHYKLTPTDLRRTGGSFVLTPKSGTRYKVYKFMHDFANSQFRDEDVVRQQGRSVSKNYTFFYGTFEDTYFRRLGVAGGSAQYVKKKNSLRDYAHFRLENITHDKRVRDSRQKP